MHCNLWPSLGLSLYCDPAKWLLCSAPSLHRETTRAAPLWLSEEGRRTEWGYEWLVVRWMLRAVAESIVAILQYQIYSGCLVIYELKIAGYGAVVSTLSSKKWPWAWWLHPSWHLWGDWAPTGSKARRWVGCAGSAVKGQGLTSEYMAAWLPDHTATVANWPLSRNYTGEGQANKFPELITPLCTECVCR